VIEVLIQGEIQEEENLDLEEELAQQEISAMETRTGGMDANVFRGLTLEGAEIIGATLYQLQFDKVFAHTSRLSENL
jgi:hypothetical protein